MNKNLFNIVQHLDRFRTKCMCSSVWLFKVHHNKISWGGGVLEPATTTDSKLCQ